MMTSPISGLPGIPVLKTQNRKRKGQDFSPKYSEKWKSCFEQNNAWYAVVAICFDTV